MITLAGQITVFMRDNGGWVVSPELTDRMVWKNQRTFKKYTSQTVRRCLRDLQVKKILAGKSYGKTMQYKWIPTELRKRYIPISQRKDDKLFTT